MRNEEGKKEKLPLYYDGENVTGKVSVWGFFVWKGRTLLTRDCIMQYIERWASEYYSVYDTVLADSIH